jgi:hypothetical protein
MKYCLAALVIAGCIYESGGGRTSGSGGSGGFGSGGSGGGPPDAGGQVGWVQLTWTVGDQQTGARISCRSGETVIIDVGGNTTSFACPMMGATLGPIPVGTYDVRGWLLDGGGNVESMQVIQGITVNPNLVSNAGNMFFLVDNRPGTVTLTWEVRSMATGNPDTCTMGESVQVDFGNGQIYGFACSLLGTTLSGVSPGYHVATVSLLTGSTVESQMSGAITLPPGGSTDLGHFTFYH